MTTDFSADSFTWDVITRLTFGSELHAQTTELGASYAHKFDRWLATANLMSMMMSLLGKWALRLIPKIVEEWTENGRVMWALLQQEKERIESGEKREAIMDKAYEIAMSEKMPASMTDESLRSALMSILFAGRGLAFSGNFAAFRLTGLFLGSSRRHHGGSFVLYGLRTLQAP